MIRKLIVCLCTVCVLFCSCASQEEQEQEKTDYLRMGDMYFEKGDYRRAYDWYSEGIPMIITNTDKSEDSTDYYKQSRYTFETTQDTGSKDSIIKVSIDSKGEECFYKAMDCLVLIGRYNRVISRYEKYIPLFPNYSGIDKVISNIRFISDQYMKDKEYAAAVRAEKLLIRIDAFNRDGRNAHFKIADYYFRGGNYEYAIYYFDDILAYFPNDRRIPEVYFRLGVCYYNDYRGIYYDFKALEKSGKYFRKFLELAPEHAKAADAEKYLKDITGKTAEKVLFKARFYIRRGEYSAAESYLREVKDTYRDTPQAVKAEALLAEIAGKTRKETDD